MEEILRPNGNSVTACKNSAGNQTDNFSYVDEAAANDADYVYSGVANAWNIDLYALPDTAIPSGSTINKITFRARFSGTDGYDYCKFAINIDSTTYESTAPNIAAAYDEYLWEQALNPKTSSAWTLSDINELRIGVNLYNVSATFRFGYCSQLWAVVDYTLPPAPDPPTNVAASENNSSKVVVTWTKSVGATGYKIYRDGNLIDTVGDVATYDDTSAAAPVITPGSAVASDGTSTAHVALSLSGNSIANGTQYTYKVRATNASGDSGDSNTDTGYRLAGSLGYQWQRSTDDSDADYANIDGATTASYNDTGAPENGDGRYYKCILSATGSSNQTSAADRGYRGIPAINIYSENTIKTTGSYSLKIIAYETTSEDGTISRTFAPVINLSGKTDIKFDLRSNREGENLKFEFHQAGAPGIWYDVTPDIADADEWQEVSIDMSAVDDGDKDSIDEMKITILDATAETTFYTDNVRGYLLTDISKKLQCAHTGGVLTGKWTSPEYDLGAIKDIRIWGDFVTGLTSDELYWSNLFGATDLWSDRISATDRWYNIFSPSTTGFLTAKLYYGNVTGVLSNSIDRMEMFSPEIQAKYVQIEITITDSNLGSYLYVNELNMTTAYWRDSP